MILTAAHMQMLIDGQFRDSVSGKTFPVVDPRNEEVVLHVAEADKEDVDLAVKAARKAFDSGPWPKLTGKVPLHSPADWVTTVLHHCAGAAACCAESALSANASRLP
jgi:hypothetical protein